MAKKQATKSTASTASTRKVSRVPSNIPPGGFNGKRRRYDEGGNVK